MQIAPSGYRRHVALQRNPEQRSLRVQRDEALMPELERENKELRKANEILKLASAFFAQAELDRRLKS